MIYVYSTVIVLLVLVGLLPIEIRAVKAFYRPTARLVVMLVTDWLNDVKAAWRS